MPKPRETRRNTMATESWNKHPTTSNRKSTKIETILKIKPDIFFRRNVIYK